MNSNQEQNQALVPAEQQQNNVEQQIAPAELLLFKQTVKTWLQLDNQVRQLQQVTKLKKKERDELKGSILGFMEKHNVEDLNTGDGKLKYVNKLSKPSTVNKKNLENQLVNYFQDINKAKEVTKYVMENLESKRRINLSRYIKRARNNN